MLFKRLRDVSPPVQSEGLSCAHAQRWLLHSPPDVSKDPCTDFNAGFDLLLLVPPQFAPECLQSPPLTVGERVTVCSKECWSTLTVSLSTFQFSALTVATSRLPDHFVSVLLDLFSGYSRPCWIVSCNHLSFSVENLTGKINLMGIKECTACSRTSYRSIKCQLDQFAILGKSLSNQSRWWLRHWTKNESSGSDTGIQLSMKSNDCLWTAVFNYYLIRRIISSGPQICTHNSCWLWEPLQT